MGCCTQLNVKKHSLQTLFVKVVRKGILIERFLVDFTKSIFHVMDKGSCHRFSWKNIDKNDGSLDGGQQRVVSTFLRSARNGGVALEGKDKERFNAIQLRLAELGNKFR